jgi:uncharacterized protein (DUF1501 family)
MPDRRAFLQSMAAAAASPWLCGESGATADPAGSLLGEARVLLLVELQGGNDALNTVIPWADSAYFALRPTLAVPRAAVLRLDGTTGLHPALRPLMRLWEAGELAIVRGVGCPVATLSHARSISAWDTGATDGGATRGWIARALEHAGNAGAMAIDGATGPLAGCDARGHGPWPCSPIGSDPYLAFAQALRDAARIAATPGGPAAIKLSLRGFDTHVAQAKTHARLLGALASGLATLATELKQSGRWDRVMVITYSEFGRRAAENGQGGTDHGTGGLQLVLGGAVSGGFHGAGPRLDALDAAGGIPCETDFRRVYAAVLEDWWCMPSAPVLGDRYDPLPLVRA